MSEEKQELKSCPFCGGKAHIHNIDKGWNVWFAQCNTRGCPGRGDDFKFDSSPTNAVSYDEAIKRWNTRRSPALEPLDFEVLWVEFEKFLEPHTCDLIIKPDYARNAHHFQTWLKDVCSRFGRPAKSVPSEEALRNAIFQNSDVSGAIDYDNAVKDILALLKKES